MSAETRRSSRTGRSDHPILEVARFEGRNRIRVTIVIAVLFSSFGWLYIWLGPELVAGEGFQDLLEALPPALNELFGFESFTSLEGLLASEFYTFGWIVGLGGYLAYSAAGSVAGDLQNDRMDALLAAPVTRRSVLLGKYLALLVPIVVVNVIVPSALYFESVAVGSPIAIADLAVVHLLSIPYLLVWAAVGLLLGVVVRGGRRAGRVALGLVFATWIFESFISTTDYEWAGAISPTRYFDPPEVLVQGTVDVAGAVLLSAVAALLVGASVVWFRRSDV